MYYYNGTYTPESAVERVFSPRWYLIRPWQVQGELLEAAKIVRDVQPRVILEIGSLKGGTLFVWAQMTHPRATIISVDLPDVRWGGGYDPEHARTLQRLKQPQQTLHLIRADSHAQCTFTEVQRLLGGRPIDFLFIDGDHAYEGVKKDFEMYASLVKPPGIIALHDIASGPPEVVGEVPRFWKRIRPQFDVREIVAKPDQAGFGIGLICIR